MYIVWGDHWDLIGIDSDLSASTDSNYIQFFFCDAFLCWSFFPLFQSFIQLFRERLSNWKALKRPRQYRKAWWVAVVHCCIVNSRVFSAMEGGAMNTCLRAGLKEQNGFWAFNIFIKIYWVFPRLPFGIVAYAFTLFWTTFVETAVFVLTGGTEKI